MFGDCEPRPEARDGQPTSASAGRGSVGAREASGGSEASQGQRPGAGNKLNLLLTYSGWRENTWADAVPRLLGPMGVQAVRVRCGDEATRLIQVQPIHIAVVDLGLPMASPSANRADGGAGSAEPAGLTLLRLLSRLPSPPPTVVVRQCRSEREDRRELAEALRLGAFAVLDRPATPSDTEIMLDVLRRCLARFYAGRWPSTTA